MITIKEYINNIGISKTSTQLKKDVQVNGAIQNKKLEEDKFEKNENKKIDKKKIIKIGAILTGALVIITAFLKRKQIMDFVSSLFNKKEKIPQKTPKIEPSEVKIEPSEIKIKSSEVKIGPDKVESVINDFPTPKFASKPTIQQRDEYVNELLKYMNSTPDTKLHLKALKEIEKYGIKDIDYITGWLSSPDESAIRETLKIYQKYAPNKKAYDVIEPIVIDDIKIKEDETFIEVLKTIQKLAHLENDDPNDREIILRPVRRLLDNKSEKVRKAAQETLDKLKG